MTLAEQAIEEMEGKGETRWLGMPTVCAYGDAGPQDKMDHSHIQHFNQNIVIAQRISCIQTCCLARSLGLFDKLCWE
jgi:hypothetical protein